LVEQRIRNAKVGSSTLFTGTISIPEANAPRLRPLASWFQGPMSSIANPERAPLALRVLQARGAWRVLLVLLLGAVCFLAFSTRPPEPLSTGWDKLNHAVAFAALAMAALLAFPGPGRAAWVLVPLGLIAFGGAVEVAQAFIPGRSGEWFDLAADALGIVAGAIVTLPLLGAAYPRR
jgi:VanZ family protein